MSFVIYLFIYYNNNLYINGIIFLKKKKITIALRNQICIVACKDGRHPIFGSNEQ